MLTGTDVGGTAVSTVVEAAGCSCVGGLGNSDPVPGAGSNVTAAGAHPCSTTTTAIAINAIEAGRSIAVARAWSDAKGLLRHVMLNAPDIVLWQLFTCSTGALLRHHTKHGDYPLGRRPETSLGSLIGWGLPAAPRSLEYAS
jgi:hypothetical protein